MTIEVEGLSEVTIHPRRDEVSVALNGADYERVRRAVGEPLPGYVDGALTAVGKFQGIEIIVAFERIGGQNTAPRACIAPPWCPRPLAVISNSPTKPNPIQKT